MNITYFTPRACGAVLAANGSRRLRAFIAAAFFLTALGAAAQNEELLEEEEERPQTQSVFSKALGAVGGYFTAPAKKETDHLKRYSAFSFSLGLTGIGINAATDFPIGVTDIFSTGNNKWKKDGKLIIDFDEIMKHGGMENGADFTFGFSARQLIKLEFCGEQSGLGISIAGIDARLDFNLNENVFKLLSKGINEGTVDYGATISGAAFMESIAVNWHKEQIATIKNRPLFFSFTAAHYVPLVYVPASSLNVHTENTDRVRIELDGTVQVYMPYNLLEPSKADRVDWGGLDVSLQLEYALFPILDVGITMLHIPLVPAVLHTKVGMNFNHQLLDVDDFVKNEGFDGLNTDFDFDKESASASKWAPRPLRFDVYTLYRPFRTDLFVLRPNMGFTALNPSEKATFNMGLEANLNVARFFTLSWFNGTYDGLWRNRLGFDFRLWKIARLFLNAEMRSQSYTGAWTLKGVGAEFGFKWGGGSSGLTIF